MEFSFENLATGETHIMDQTPLPNGSIELSIGEVIRKDMPNPVHIDLMDPEFNAIWDVIKSWDVNVPEYYAGYCGANGSHAMLILNALRATR